MSTTYVPSLQANTAGTALLTVVLVLIGAMLITTSTIGIIIQRECTASKYAASTNQNLKITLGVGIGMGSLIVLGSVLYAFMSR